MTNTLVILILTIIIILVLFFAIRKLMLWYWRVDEIYNQLQEQTQILRIAFADQLKIHENKFASNYQSQPALVEGIIYDLPSNLTLKEKDLLVLKSSQLKAGQVVVMDLLSRRIEIWVQDEFETLVKKKTQGDKIIVAKKDN